jgi:probable addiction module antidote protein
MAKKIIHEKLTNYDPAEDLGSDEAIAAFMAEAFQTNDAGYIAHALGVVARAKGMTQIAGQTGLSREQLYRSFSAKGNPKLKTTLAVRDPSASSSLQRFVQRRDHLRCGQPPAVGPAARYPLEWRFVASHPCDRKNSQG